MSDQEVLDLDQTTPQSPSEQGMEKYFFRASAADFKKIPGSPIAYWVSDNIRSIFENAEQLGNLVEPRQGMATTDNNQFLRLWHETSSSKIKFDATTAEEAVHSQKTWFPYNKGGGFRKWFGNNDYVVNYFNDGESLKKVVKEKYRDRDYAKGFTDERWDKLIEVWVLKNQQFYFMPSVTWTFISSAYFGVRASDSGFIFDVGGSSIFPINEGDIQYYTAYLCSKLGSTFLNAINPTLNFQVENIAALPVILDIKDRIFSTINSLSTILTNNSRSDWDSYETSWDFTTLPLLHPEHHAPSLAKTYENLRAHWLENTLEMQRLEEENNRIFIDAYGLQDELTPDVPLKEITLTCNPHYRYGGDKTDEELDVLLRADTVREFISYAVGCMFGRYSLDKPGLVLANQGESLEDYLAQVPEPSFMPDADNVIPLLDGDWFVDDITERFRQFLRVTFGDAHYEENLAFVEAALGKNIRRYFVQDFYKDHVQTYKRRPIYWLFSSPKGSFNALIYMHRYTPDTVSIVLNDYLREFRTKLVARKAHLESVGISADASKREKASALKEITKLDQMITEVDDYERDVLYPLATQKIEIDLDDGVKENYPKFGKALNNAPKL